MEPPESKSRALNLNFFFVIFLIRFCVSSREGRPGIHDETDDGATGLLASQMYLFFWFHGCINGDAHPLIPTVCGRGKDSDAILLSCYYRAGIRSPF